MSDQNNRQRGKRPFDGQSPAARPDVDSEAGMTHDWLDGEVLLTEFDLARRQRRSVKTIRNQRVLGTGIPFTKIGRLVRYRLRDVITSEQDGLRKSTSEGGGRNRASADRPK